jgi:hypothetical protein
MSTNKSANSNHWDRFRRLLSLAEDRGDSFCEKNWAPPDDQLPERDKLWAQYTVFVDLYKHYLEIAWKASVWYYAITGAILTYYLSHVSDQLPGPLPLVLLFLAFVSFGFALLYYKGADNLESLRDLLEGIALAQRLPGRPHVEFAIDFVMMNAVLMGSVGLASLVLFGFDSNELAAP